MMAENSRRDAAAEIFTILAELFKYPDEVLLQQIGDGSVDDALENLFAQAGYLLPRPSLQQHAMVHSDLRRMYTSCFLGVEKPCAVPVESVYKVWTTDPSAQIGISSSKGYLMGDSALHILHLLEHFGLEAPSEYAQIPDHLAILLELLAYCLQHRTAEETATFLADHFDWLGDLKAALAQTKEHAFYTYAVDLVRAAASAAGHQLASPSPY